MDTPKHSPEEEPTEVHNDLVREIGHGAVGTEDHRVRQQMSAVELAHRKTYPDGHTVHYLRGKVPWITLKKK